jgi:hypothetical protein
MNTVSGHGRHTSPAEKFFGNFLNFTPPPPPLQVADTQLVTALFSPKPLLHKGCRMVPVRETASHKALLPVGRPRPSLYGTRLPLSGTRLPLSGTRLPLSGTRLPLSGTRLPLCLTRLPLCLTRPPLCLTRPPLCLTRLPLCLTRPPLCLTRLPFHNIKSENSMNHLKKGESK